MTLFWLSCRNLFKSDTELDASSSSEDDAPFVVDTSQTPIYDRLKKGYSVIDLFNIILNSDKDKNCSTKPVGVQSFASYKIDLTQVKLADLTADDNGIWRVSLPRRRYRVTMVDGIVIGAKEVKGQATTNDDVFTVTRQYGIHAGTSEFRRIITTIKNSQNVLAKYAIVQYLFTGGKRIPVTLPAHGNSSSNHPHIQTGKSVRSAIQSSSTTKSPSEVYATLFSASGGITEGTSLSEQPRNRKQIYNARYTCTNDSNHDELYTLFSQLQTHSKKPDGFLREILFNPLPAAVLFFDLQIECLLSFCCNISTTHGLHCGILGIDATFNLGDFYVTLTTFQHPQIIRRTTRKNPVFLGPIFIHMQRRFEDYYYFFTTLLKHAPTLCMLGAYGTDGELALVKALALSFPNAVGLRCFIHKQRT